MWLPRIRLSSFPYLEHATQNIHGLLGIACYSESCLDQKHYSGSCNGVHEMAQLNVKPVCVCVVTTVEKQKTQILFDEFSYSFNT